MWEHELCQFYASGRGKRERERENSWKRRFKKMASPSPAACPGEEEQCRSKTQSFCDSVCFFFWKKEMNLGVTQKWVMTLDHMLMKLTRVHSSYHYLNILFYEKSSDSYMGC